MELFDTMVDLSPSTEGITFALAHSKSNNLSDFLGLCTVLSMESGTGDVSAEEVVKAISAVEKESKSASEENGTDYFTQSRFLFKTKTDNGVGGRFLSSDAIKILSELGAQLVGIDMPSLASENLSEEPKFSYIINLCLDLIDSGHNYTLLAPPLLMQEISPVPVRPVLAS